MESPIRTPWIYDTEPFKITDGLYYVGNRDVSIHLFDTGDGLLLLDTGYPQTIYLLLESIHALGFAPHEIRWILHTHAHIDHFGATRMLCEKFGCKTYLPAADLPLLNERAELNYCAEFGLLYEPPYDTCFTPDVLVEPDTTLVFGNIRVEAFSAAGHTPGTMCYLFHMPGGLTAAMHGGVGRNTLRSEYIRRYGLGTAWREAYAESIQRLRGLKVDIVLGNHPNQAHVFEKRANHRSFVDSEEWDRFLKECWDKYQVLLTEEPFVL